MYIFSSVIGIFVFDEKLEIVDKSEFSSLTDYRNKEEIINRIKNRHKDIKEPDEEILKKILSYFKDKKYIDKFREINLSITKLDIKNSVNEDSFIIQAVKSIEEIDKLINSLAKRLREWYEIHNPEFSRAVQDHKKFAHEILEYPKEELLEKLGIKMENSMGADLNKKDIEPIKRLAQQICHLFQLRENSLGYISAVMDLYCPNTRAVCDVIVGARLIEHAGSLKRLSLLPASTIQILGAEKALFRHMKTGAKSPKHGIIVGHPLISAAPLSLHGKLARALADKISIAAKVDYFRGKFIGDRLREELENKFR